MNTPRHRSRFWRAAVAAVALLLSSATLAGDWVMAAGSEEGRTGDIVPWGFAQLLVETQPWSSPVVGLQAPPLQPFNGHFLAADVEGVDVSVRRARVGLRGIVPGTDDRVNMLFAIEAGQNALTRDRGVVLVDASVSVRLVESLRLRLGQFKLPTSDEAIEHNPSMSATTSFSPFVAALLIEQDVVDGRIAGPAAALRDVGAQLFDAVPLWAGDTMGLELSWAAMASIGSPAHRLAALSIDPDAYVDATTATASQLEHTFRHGPELTGRLQLSLLLDPAARKKPRRDELSAWIWSQHGQRDVDGEVFSRRRSGVGAQLQRDGVRLRAEAVVADGVLLAPPALVGQRASIVADGEAHGGSIDASVGRVAGFDLAPFTIDASFDWLQRGPGDAAAERTLQALTLGVQWKLNRELRLITNVLLPRQLVGSKAPADAAIIAAALSPMVSTQLNLVF
jgi:hypothetical protein